MLPSFKTLQVYEAVARHHSFTRAADELNVTQSAVSHQVKQLEQTLGIDLLNRHGRSFILTEAGSKLARSLSEAVKLIKRGVKEARMDRTSVPLGISLRPHFASNWLAPRLASLWRQHPGFDIRFHHSSDPADFSNPAIHIGIDWLGDQQVSPDHIKLIDGNLTPACHPQVVNELKIRTPGDLGLSALLHEADGDSWQQWLSLAKIPNLQVTRNVYYDDTNVRQQAAIQGAGFALVCPQLVTEDIESGRLVCPFELRLSNYSYYLSVPANLRDIPNVRIFIDWILAQ